jgi:hypothetical protein
MKKLLFISACLIALAACQREEIKELITVSFEVSDVEADASKATYDSQAHKVAWEYGDEIGCFAEMNNNIKFSNSQNAPTSFTGSVWDTPSEYFFYHPFTPGVTANGTVVTTTYPAEQTLRANDFAAAPLMVATSKDLSAGVNFHNACGLVRFTVTTDEARKLVSAEFSGNNGELIAGTCTVDMASSTPSAKIASGGSSKITMKGEVFMQEGKSYSFILALPPTSFTKGIAITLKDENGNSYTKSFDKAMNLDRNKAINVSTVLEFTEANASPAVDLQVTAFDLTGISGETIKIDNENNTITVSKTGFTNPQKLATKMAVSATGSSEAVTVTLNPTTTIVAGGTIHPDNTGVISNLSSFTMNLMMPRTVTLACGSTTETYTIKFSQLSNLGLPVVYINTATGKDVPVNAKDTWIEGSEIYIDADGKKTFDGVSFSDLANIECEIKGRGNTTWEWVEKTESQYTIGAKRPYAIKLDKKKEVLGMAEHKRWVLLNNFCDKSMVRNYVAYRLANKLAEVGSKEWHPSGQHVELVLNGVHRGTYLLCEQIKISDGNRVKGVEYDDKKHTPAVTSEISYLLEGDRNWGHNETGDPTETLYWESYRYNTSWQQSSTSNFTYMYGTNYGKSTSQKYPDGSKWYKFRWGLKSPDDGDLGSSATGKATGAYQFINGRVTAVENIIFGNSFTTASLDEINEYINLDSFIEYWLVYEMTLNQEPNNPGSCYMHYYNGDGKLYMGPVWDFDYGAFLGSADGFTDGELYLNTDEHFLIANSLWYCRLLQNKNVQNYINSKWQAYRTAAEEVVAEMATLKTYLNKAQESNFTIYPMSSSADPNGERSKTYDQAYDRIKKNLNNRLSKLDPLITNNRYN